MSLFRQRALIYEWNPLTVSHHFAIFGGHWSSASGEIAFLICHMSSQDHMIKGSCDFMGENSSLYAIPLPNAVAVGIMVAEI